MCNAPSSFLAINKIKLPVLEILKKQKLETTKYTFEDLFVCLSSLHLSKYEISSFFDCLSLILHFIYYNYQIKFPNSNVHPISLTNLQKGIKKNLSDYLRLNKIEDCEELFSVQSKEELSK